MKNQLLASLPLVIALFGASDIDLYKDRMEMRVRLAPSSLTRTINPAELNTDQQAWLDEQHPLGTPEVSFPGKPYPDRS